VRWPHPPLKLIVVQIRLLNNARDPELWESKGSAHSTDTVKPFEGCGVAPPSFIVSPVKASVRSDPENSSRRYCFGVWFLRWRSVPRNESEMTNKPS
jgi:hypothetical protein